MYRNSELDGFTRDKMPDKYTYTYIFFLSEERQCINTASQRWWNYWDIVCKVLAGVTCTFVKALNWSYLGSRSWKGSREKFESNLPQALMSS